jgi:ATP-dependent DNA helicase RecQ
VANLRSQLQTFFGFDSFLDSQEAVVERVTAGENLCVIMPTGAGKSLCYQLPAVCRDGYTVVLSPLISLMKDQVDALCERGIAAAFVNSTLSPAEQNSVLNSVADGELKLLYVAPERFRSARFRELLQRQPPTMVVVDEAHCISQWGHDFRPDYARIGERLQALDIAQVCAFTATATPLVRDDIVRQLRRPMDPVVAGFIRPNLSFRVSECRTVDEKIDVIRRLADEQKPTIVYAATRKHVEQVAAALGCLRYHAGLSDIERTEAQDRFMADPAPIVAATNAFGMGIDRPDVRRVIHFNIPGSLEAYYQEAGRAGRDGEDAECLLLFSYQDRYVHEFFIEMSHPPKGVVLQTYNVLRQLAATSGNTQLEIPVSQIASRVPGAKGDQQIGAALKLLEGCGAISRGFRQQNRGTLLLTQSFDALRQRFPRPDTQRGVFVHRVCNHYGNELFAGVSCTYDDLSAVSGLNHDQLLRVLRALRDDGVDWTPPFSGRGLRLETPEAAAPDIDFSEVEHHADLEHRRLDEMFSYPQTHDCRQRYMIEYFGQAAGDWRCRLCDRCAGTTASGVREELTPEQLAVVRTALRGATALRGRYGRHRTAQFLFGSRNQALLDAGLHRTEGYGSLRRLGLSAILGLLKACAEASCISTTGEGRYPVIRVTALGRHVLGGTRAVPMALPPEVLQAIGGASAAVADDDDGDGDCEQDDLFDKLRALRNKMAKQRGVPPYRVLNNATLKALVDKRPVTTAEARTVPGIGPQKAEQVLPAFLAIIKTWRDASVAEHAGDG